MFGLARYCASMLCFNGSNILTHTSLHSWLDQSHASFKNGALFSEVDVIIAVTDDVDIRGTMVVGDQTPEYMGSGEVSHFAFFIILWDYVK